MKTCFLTASDLNKELSGLERQDKQALCYYLGFCSRKSLKTVHRDLLSEMAVLTFNKVTVKIWDGGCLVGFFFSS